MVGFGLAVGGRAVDLGGACAQQPAIRDGAIYEVDFVGFSMDSGLGRSPRRALRARCTLRS